MLIILFVGLALLALASVLLRRRYMRKKEARASLMHMSAPVESWYPHQRSVHDLGVAGYGMGRTGDMQRENEKGKGVVGVGVDEHRMKDPEGKRGRLKKGWLGGGR